MGALRFARRRLMCLIKTLTCPFIIISAIIWNVIMCQNLKYVRWKKGQTMLNNTGYPRLRGVIPPSTVVPLDRIQLQKWRSLLVIGGLMVAGCLLLLHLHVVDSLSTYTTLHNANGELVDDMPVLEPYIFIKEANIVDNILDNNQKNVGVPEAEMVGPVNNDPLLDAALQLNLEVEPTAPRPNRSRCAYQDLKKALFQTAVKKEIFIQLIPDSAHVVLAKNNLDTLVRRTGNANLLFICRDVLQCETTRDLNVSCYIDDTLPGSNVPLYTILLTTLQLRYNFIYMDFESSIINKIPSNTKPSMVIPYKVTPKAQSFYKSVNSPLTVRFHKMAVQDAQLHPNKTFAAIFKSVLDKSLKMSPALAVENMVGCVKLPNDPTCPIIRHPRFSAPADRMLWLKEKQMWFSNSEGYYTNPNAAYLIYENNYDMGKRTIEYEIHALKNALAIGDILNRFVILPKFLCPKCKANECKPANCLLAGILNMTSFDSVFGGMYREHSFRGHPMVPLATKKNVSENIQIASPLRRGMKAAGGVEILPKITPNKIITSDNFYEGPDSDEILELFSSYNKKLLRFVNLYGAFSGFNSARKSLEFERQLKQGIMPLVKL